MEKIQRKRHANFKEIEFSKLNSSCFPRKYAVTVDILIAFTKQFIFFWKKKRKKCEKKFRKKKSSSLNPMRSLI